MGFFRKRENRVWKWIKGILFGILIYILIAMLLFQCSLNTDVKALKAFKDNQIQSNHNIIKDLKTVQQDVTALKTKSSQLQKQAATQTSQINGLKTVMPAKKAEPVNTTPIIESPSKWAKVTAVVVGVSGMVVKYGSKLIRFIPAW